MKYTFNGLGEYVLLRVTSNATEQGEAEPFIALGRTAKALDANGTETSATVFSAFAFRDNGTEVMQIEMNENRTGESSINYLK